MGLWRSFFANKNTVISFLFIFVTSCNSQNNGLSGTSEDDLNENNSSTNPVLANYDLIRHDDFGFFDAVFCFVSRAPPRRRSALI